MEVYVCDLCDYVYNPERGDEESNIAPGTAWDLLPEDWVCPVCGARKTDFNKKDK